MQKKILFFHSDHILKNDILWGLLEIGVDAVVSGLKISLALYDEEMLQNALAEIRKEAGCDAVMSQDFSPVLAEAAHQCGIPYIAWLYDCVLSGTYQKERLYDTNFVVTFDRIEQRNFLKRGIKNAIHLPLATNVTKTGTLQVTEEDIARFGSDISFVGSLYHKDYVDQFLGGAPEHIQNLFLEAFNRYAFTWEKGVYWEECFSEELVEYIREKGLIRVEKEFIDYPYPAMAQNMFLPPAIANQERVNCLKILSEYFKLRLYTNDRSASSIFPEKMIFPPVSLETDLYRVYYASKINLGFTLRTISTGLPQRIFDIMSVGGFVLSNYQEEAEEFFVPDKEIVLFHSVEEMVEKCFYYLQHETERQRIGIAGYQRVAKCYTYPIVLRKMLEQVFF